MKGIKVSDTIRLCKVKRYKSWQAEIKQSNGKWRRVSTGTDNDDEAKVNAIRKEQEWLLLEERGIPTIENRSFKYVAEKYIQKLEQQKKVGTLNASKGTYIGIIRNYQIPFFGSKSITNIGTAEVMLYDEFRDTKMGVIPAKGTVNKHNVALRAVFDFAVQHKWMKASEVPKLTVKGKGRKSQARGAFEVEEYNDLIQFLVESAKKADKKMSKYKRELMMVYVNFLVSSGMRPGLESEMLTWGDFEYIQTTEDKRDYYRIYVRYGKKRDLHNDEVAHRTVVISVEQYESLLNALWYIEPARIGLEPDKDRLLFAYTDGEKIKGFSEL